MSSVSIDKSYAVRPRDWKTCSRVRWAPSRNITTSYCNGWVIMVRKHGTIWCIYLGTTLHLGFDETKKMLLVHAA